MNKKELSDKTSFLWTLFGITLLLFIFQKLGKVFENATELDLYHLLSLLLIILSSSQVYYGLIHPKIIDSYTNEWIRKDIKRDIRIGTTSFLHSLPMVIFIIGICILFHFSGFYPSLWQSALCYICISSAIFLMRY